MIKFIAASGFITTALAMPNAVQIFDNPSRKLLNRPDSRQRDRELRRVMHYMKRCGLLRYNSPDYEHGIRLTLKGRLRLKRTGFNYLAIPTPTAWDKKWWLVFIDIPETKKAQA